MSNFFRALGVTFLVGTGVSAAPLKPMAIVQEPDHRVQLQAPVTLTIKDGSVTVESGSLSISPEGKSCQGCVIRIENGTIVFDPIQPKPSKP